MAFNRIVFREYVDRTLAFNRIVFSELVSPVDF
jgi:hypothetical protein